MLPTPFSLSRNAALFRENLRGYGPAPRGVGENITAVTSACPAATKVISKLRGLCCDYESYLCHRNFRQSAS